MIRLPILLILLFLIVPGLTQAEQTAVQHVEQLRDKTIETISNDDTDEKAKRFVLWSEFSKAINFQVMGDFVYRRLNLRLNKLEKRRFNNLYKHDLIARLWTYLDQYQDQTIDITADESGETPSSFVRVIIEGSGEMALDMHPTDTPGEWLAHNIVINDVNLNDVITEDYQAIYQEKKWDGLRKELERRMRRN